MNTKQIEMVNIEQLVSKNHTYRVMHDLFNFEKIANAVETKESYTGAVGFIKKTSCYVLCFAIY